jgi:hypothetical protein
MTKNNLQESEKSTIQLAESTEANLRKWAIKRGYTNPLIYSSNKCKCILIMDIETGFLGAIATDETTQSKIEKTLNLANKISSLPSDELQALAYTDDLKEEFNIQRNDSAMIGKSFIFADLDIDGDPLQTEKQKGIVNQWTEEIINQTAYCYRALLELLTVAFKDIKKAFPNISFTNSEQLLFEIVRDNRDFYFEVIASSDFAQILTEELVDFWQGTKSGKSGEEFKKRYTAKNLGSVYRGEWLHQCLEFLQEKAKKNKMIHGRLKIYYTECDLLADAIAEACKARDSQGKIKKSIQWRLGQALIFDNRNRPTIPLQGYKT